MNKIITYSFGESFIDNLIEYIEANYLKKDQDLIRLAVVFGGKRPALFVKRALAKRIHRSFFPPRFFTIDEFMAYTLRKQEAFSPTVDLDSCYLLYQLARTAAPQILHGRAALNHAVQGEPRQRQESFAQFLPWTREILDFIEQLDLEHVEDESLIHIQSNAQIGYDVPADINRLLENVTALRRAYHEALIRKGMYSRGLQYLRAARVVEQCDFEEFDQILFCNFFYFNRSEEAVIKNLYGREKATLIFQGDERKWPVLKRIAGNFSCTIQEADQPPTPAFGEDRPPEARFPPNGEARPKGGAKGDLRRPAFQLKLYEGFDTHSQVALVREILKGIERVDRTVIVLPHPESLIPLLSEMTALVKDFNISMGYPLKRSSLFSLFQFMFKAQLSRKEGKYYAKDYLRVLRHPFVKNLKLSVQPAATRILIHKIEEILTGKEHSDLSGTLFVRLEDMEALGDVYFLTAETLTRLGIPVPRPQLRAVLKELHQLLFLDWEAVDNFLSFSQVLGKFLEVMVDKSFLKNYPLNLNIASQMHAVKDEFQNAAFNKETFPQEEIFKIFENKIEHAFVAFSGSPLKGLQILGLFETRSLNFEHVIVCDVNEGLLPKLNVYEPLIPREVMISLNLDRLELEEEIQRYQFMRLISSAKNVHLIYQQSRDKEKSRFIEELIWEEQKRHKRLQVIPKTRGGFELNAASKKRVIRKTAEVVKFLRDLEFSASSINTYLKDPWEFYYRYVLGIKEQDDLLDEPDARHVGTFIHELLDETFRPFLRKRPSLDADFRRRFFRRFEQKFDETFARTMKSDSFLLKYVMGERLSRFLDNEQFSDERQVAEILFLEKRFVDTIPLSAGEVKFKYVIDRIDQLDDGTVMIIDYKTGGLNPMPASFDRIARMELSRETIREKIKSFQIPLYFYYLDREFHGQPVNAALYNLRTLKLDKFIDPGTIAQRQEAHGVFLRALDFIIAEILDPNVDFVEEEDH